MDLLDEKEIKETINFIKNGHYNIGRDSEIVINELTNVIRFLLKEIESCKKQTKRP